MRQGGWGPRVWRVAATDVIFVSYRKLELPFMLGAAQRESISLWLPGLGPHPGHGMQPATREAELKLCSTQMEVSSYICTNCKENE